jgi:hypothetical protein
MSLQMFPVPQRDSYRTDSYRLMPTAAYRRIHQLVALLIALQLLTLAVLLAGVLR